MDKAITDFKQHCLEVYPNEAVGVITANDEYTKLINVSDNPENSFDVDPIEYETIRKEIGVKFLLHSHPYDVDSPETVKARRTHYDLRTPSVADRKAQKSLGVPFGIAQTDGEDVSQLIFFGGDIEPLEGRNFIYGVNDCFTLVRDWYKQEHNIELYDRITPFRWWANGENTYEDYYEQDGWVEVDARIKEPGDILLMTYRSPVPNHIAIFIDSSTILHHMYGELSCKAPLGMWNCYTNKVLRYEG